MAKQADAAETPPEREPRARRERNRQHTRAALREAAERLFLEHGFAAVSVAQVARAAGVTEKTAFNHFPTKEDLLYVELDRWQERMVEAIRGRPPGLTMLDAFCAFVAAPTGLLNGDPEDREKLARISRLVLETPSLLAREAQSIERYTQVLADVLAEERGLESRDPQAWVAAHAMMGVHRALLDHVRRRLASGRSTRRLAAEVSGIARESCAMLGGGLDALG